MQELVYSQVWRVLGPNVKNENGTEVRLPETATCQGRGPYYPEADADWQCAMLLAPSTLAANEDAMRERGAVAFINAAFDHPTSEVALTSCNGHWNGCIPSGAPALVYHHGTNDKRIDSYRPKVQALVKMWVINFGDSWLRGANTNE